MTIASFLSKAIRNLCGIKSADKIHTDVEKLTSTETPTPTAVSKPAKKKKKRSAKHILPTRKRGHFHPRNRHHRNDLRHRQHSPIPLRAVNRIDQFHIFRRQIPPEAIHVFSRHAQTSCHALDALDRMGVLNTVRPKLPEQQTVMTCYGCHATRKSPHPVYLYSCFQCGERFQQNRYLARDLSGSTAVVTGARTKLGHQVTLKLLRAGATVVGTTRRPGMAADLFREYPDSHQWMHRLHLLLVDLDSPDLHADTGRLVDYIRKQVRTQSVEILVNCAAQTIRARDKAPQTHSMDDDPKNRYGDSKHVDPALPNSWNLRLEDLRQQEMEEVLRVNTVAPTLLLQQLWPFFLRSRHEKVHIVNVHAREGRMQCDKDDRHLHTNLAKAGLAMVTKCLHGRCEREQKQNKHGPRFCVHGCDPGWISIDEYYADSCPWVVPPLDEVDGAARILYPVWKNLSGRGDTRIHFEQFTY